MKGSVYLISCDLEDIFCVGSTVKNVKGHASRWNQYKYDCTRGSSLRICQEMRRIGFAHFDIETIETYEVDTLPELRQYEQLWIETLTTAGYNLTNTRRAHGLQRSTEALARIKKWRTTPSPCPFCGQHITNANLATHKRKWCSKR